jgi:ATP-dependent DNA ligase
MSVALLRDDGRWQLLGAVGTGFSEEDRAEWHGRLSSREVPSTFRLANREGTLSKFVRPEIVIEVRVSDLLESDSWDAPIRRMCPRATTHEAGWRAGRGAPRRRS